MIAYDTGILADLLYQDLLEELEDDAEACASPRNYEKCPVNSVQGH